VKPTLKDISMEKGFRNSITESLEQVVKDVEALKSSTVALFNTQNENGPHGGGVPLTQFISAIDNVSNHITKCKIFFIIIEKSKKSIFIYERQRINAFCNF